MKPQNITLFVILVIFLSFSCSTKLKTNGKTSEQSNDKIAQSPTAQKTNITLNGKNESDKDGTDKNESIAKPKSTIKTGTPVIKGPPASRLSRKKLSAAHILIMHKESKDNDAHVKRSKQAASKLAGQLHAQLEKGADFAQLAAKHSDCPSGKEEGGDLGVFPAYSMDPDFVSALLKLEEDQISAPVETAIGFHIIKRQKIEFIHARHILLMHQKSQRKPSFVTRSKKDAQILAKDLLAKLQGNDDFMEIAKKHSDCPSGKRSGGDLGRFTKGRMNKNFEKVAFELKINELSDVVETPFGFHIIQRLPL